MIIDETLVSGVAAIAQQVDVDEDLKGALKTSYPEIRFTLCSEDDIHSGKPVMESDRHAIYLVGNGEHCLTLTNDYTLATGVVVADIETE